MDGFIPFYKRRIPSKKGVRDYYPRREKSESNHNNLLVLVLSVYYAPLALHKKYLGFDI